MTAFSFDTRMVCMNYFCANYRTTTAFIVSFLRKIPSSVQSLCALATLIINTVQNCQTYSASSRNEFWQLFTMLALGASIAATHKSCSRFIINAVGGVFCRHIHDRQSSSFDMLQHRRIALAYVRNFNRLTLSFLLFGPMIDIKMIALLKTTFRWKFIATITLTVFIYL